MSTHNLCLEQKYENYLNFLSDLFFLCKIFSLFEKAYFRNEAWYFYSSGIAVYSVQARNFSFGVQGPLPSKKLGTFE